MFRLLKGNKKIVGLILYCLSIIAIIIASIIIYNKYIDSIEHHAKIFVNSNDSFDKFVYYGKLSAMYNILSGILLGGFLIAEISYLILLEKKYIKKQIVYSIIISLILIANVMLQVINPLIFAPQNLYALILIIGIVLIVIGIREFRIEKIRKIINKN